jgi:hypothetical protein
VAAEGAADDEEVPDRVDRRGRPSLLRRAGWALSTESGWVAEQGSARPCGRSCSRARYRDRGRGRAAPVGPAEPEPAAGVRELSDWNYCGLGGGIAMRPSEAVVAVAAAAAVLAPDGS